MGEKYQLTVRWNNSVFTSSGTLLAPPTVDSVTYEYQEDRLFRDEGYYIKVYGEIPFEEDNYYRIRVIENDTLKNDRDDYNDGGLFSPPPQNPVSNITVIQGESDVLGYFNVTSVLSRTVSIEPEED